MSEGKVLGGRIPKRMDDFDEATRQMLHEAKVHHDRFLQLQEDARAENAVSKRLIMSVRAAGMPYQMIASYIGIDINRVFKVTAALNR